MFQFKIVWLDSKGEQRFKIYNSLDQATAARRYLVRNGCTTADIVAVYDNSGDDELSTVFPKKVAKKA